MVINLLTSRIMDMIAIEMNKPESQEILKRKIVTPLINLLFVELYPYILMVSIVICFILFLSILTFIALLQKFVSFKTI